MTDLNDKCNGESKAKSFGSWIVLGDALDLVISKMLEERSK